MMKIKMRIRVVYLYGILNKLIVTNQKITIARMK